MPDEKIVIVDDDSQIRLLLKDRNLRKKCKVQKKNYAASRDKSQNQDQAINHPMSDQQHYLSHAFGFGVLFHGGN